MSTRMNELNDDNTFKEDVIIVQMAQNTKIPGKVGLMINNKIYLGDKEYYSQGLYDNSDKTLIFISDNNNMFPFLVGRDYPDAASDLIKRGELNLEDFKEYAKLKNSVLDAFQTVRTGDVSFNGKSFDDVFSEILEDKKSNTSEHKSPVDRMKDYRKEVTERIVKMIEQGTAPWQRPWDLKKAMMARPHNINGRPYHGINSLLLWSVSMDKGYNDPRWLTFKQINELGGKIKKGEKSVVVEYWQWTKKEVDKETGEEQLIKLEKPRRFTANVFNAMQTTGLPELKIEPLKFSPHERAENIIKAAGVNIIESIDGRAYYSPNSDLIAVPPKNTFATQDGYYSTVLHEIGHSTGHKSRLNRFEPGAKFGNAVYAREELRAELASTFLCNELGIAHEMDNQQHAAYVGHWIKTLREDYNEIFRAASDADKIVTYLYEREKEYLKNIEQQKNTEQKPVMEENLDLNKNRLKAKDFYLTHSKIMLDQTGKVDNEKIAKDMLKAGFSCYLAKQAIYKYSNDKNFEKACSAVNKAMKDPEIKKSMQKTNEGR